MAANPQNHRPLGRALQARIFRVVNVFMRRVLGLPFATPVSRNLMLCTSSVAEPATSITSP